ncbi:MAG: DUF6879 family protein [Actinocatenispora sp.]
MSHWLTGEEFAALFTSFDDTAWHLETRGKYSIADEQDAYTRFLAGQPVGTDWFRPWLDQVRELTAKGCRIGRVRLLDDPPTDYQRFELWGTPHNVAAGEEVSMLPTAAGRRLGLPDHDFWLFDSKRVVVSHFTDDGRLTGDQMFTDPETVDTHRQWWDVAVTHAVPYRADGTEA